MIESVDVIHGSAIQGPKTCVLYEVLIRFCDRRPTHSVLHSYERFVDFKMKLIAIRELTHLGKNFPRALKRNLIGVPISKHQNDLRCDLLNRWLNRVMRESVTFPHEALHALSVFLNLPMDLLHYTEEKDKFDPVATEDQHMQLEALIEQAHNNITSDLGVSVRLGKRVSVPAALPGTVVDSTHPTYETMIQYDINKPVFVASRRFEAYRKLFKDLYKGLFDENRAQTPLEEDMLLLEGKFPRTFKRSFFGIKMSEDDLKNRCAGLAYWMSGILTRYHMLDIERKYLVNEFLKINTHKTAEEGVRNKAIIHALSRRASARSTCTEAHISYAPGESVAVRSPSIAIPPRESSNDLSIPEIPIEYRDGPETNATTTTGHVPVTGQREVVGGDRLNARAAQEGTKEPATVFGFEDRSSAASRGSSDLETIHIESTESAGSCLDNTSLIFSSVEYADDCLVSVDDETDFMSDNSDLRASDGFLCEEELHAFEAAKKHGDGRATSHHKRSSFKEECIIS